MRKIKEVLRLKWERGLSNRQIAAACGVSRPTYSWFCEHYRAWRGKLDLVMRQEHRAGEKLFVDYAGQTVPIIDRTTGEIHEAQIFVAVMGASNYTYAEATRSQALPDWIGSHVRAFQYLNGVPELVVPDYVPGHIIRLMFPIPLCSVHPDHEAGGGPDHPQHDRVLLPRP